MTDINILDTIEIGKINSYESKKASSITPISFPGQSEALTEGVDTLGIISYINISGRLTGDWETMQGTIHQIQNLLDGAQTLSFFFYSPFISSTRIDTTIVPTRRTGHLGTNTTASANKLIDSTANYVTWGIQDGTTVDVDNITMRADYVKNLTTGVRARITNVDAGGQQLTLDADIFPVAGGTGVSYAVTANINVKVLSFDVRWELPGMTYVNYTLSLIQVR